MKLPSHESDCLYVHRDTAGVMFYVGIGAASRPFSYKHRSAKWLQFINTLDYFDVEVLFWCNDRELLLTSEKKLIEEHKPVCNKAHNPDVMHPLKGRVVGRGNRKLSANKRITAIPIVCNETREEYPSIYAAARTLSVGGPAISNHLKGKQSGNLKGYTFEYL